MLADGLEPKWSSHYLAFHAHLWRGAEGDLDRALELQQEVLKGYPQLRKKTQQLVIKACTRHVCMWEELCCSTALWVWLLSLPLPSPLSGRGGLIRHWATWLSMNRSTDLALRQVDSIRHCCHHWFVTSVINDDDGGDGDSYDRG